MASVDSFQTGQLAFSLAPASCERCLFAPQFAAGCPGAGTSDACTEGTLNPGQDDFGERMTECGGLDLDLTRARPQALRPLPGFVPQVDGSPLGRGVKRPWVAVRLRDWRRATRGAEGQATDLHRVLNIHPDAKILLLLFANDRMLEEQLWPYRHAFLDDVERWKPDAVAGPDFSVWLTRSWIDRQYSMALSVRFFGLLQEREIPAIPNIYWGDNGQMDQWIRWLNTNPVSTIVMDLQCLRPSREAQFITELRDFQRQLDPPPHLLVAGRGTEGPIRNIGSIWQNASFTSNSWMVAHKRRSTHTRPDGSTTRVVVEKGDPARLLHDEIERIEAIINEPLTLWSSLVFGRTFRAQPSGPDAQDGLWSRGFVRHRHHAA